MLMVVGWVVGAIVVLYLLIFQILGLRIINSNEVAVIEKNLSYAKRKEEELCKQIGYGDSINLSTTSQQLKGKA